jgi:hypothetical protein
MSVIATAMSQKYNKYNKYDEQEHELSLYGIGGYFPVPYVLSGNGKKGGNIGGSAGVEYIFHFNPSIGIIMGVEMADYRSKVSFGSAYDEYNTGTGKNMLKFSYSLRDFEERQNIMQLSIPIMVQYSLPLDSYGSVSLYAAGGLKLGFPLKAKTRITQGTVTTSGYYPYENIEYKNLPKHGFVTDEPLPDVRRDIDVGFSNTILAFDVGARFSLTDKIGLYTGLYLDYRLLGTGNRQYRNLIEYNDPALIYNSVLNTGLMNRENMMSIGLKVKIGLKL